MECHRSRWPGMGKRHWQALSAQKFFGLPRVYDQGLSTSPHTSHRRPPHHDNKYLKILTSHLPNVAKRYEHLWATGLVHQQKPNIFCLPPTSIPKLVRKSWILPTLHVLPNRNREGTPCDNTA